MLLAGAIALALLVLGAPVFAAMLTGSGSLMVSLGKDLSIMPMIMYQAIDKYGFLCMPYFMLSGFVMSRTGISSYLIRFADAWIGHLPGGLGLVTIISCMMFSTLSGSSVATALAIGSVTIDPMVEMGYDKKFAAGLAVVGGTLGVLIPPSIPMILYATITETSVIHLFTAGFIPGAVIGGLLLLSVSYWSWKHRWGIHPPASWRMRFQTLMKALPILSLPLVVLGGIYGGIFTATEAAAISVVWSVILACVYRKLTLKTFLDASKETAISLGMVTLVVAAAILFGKGLTELGLGSLISNAVARMGLGFYGILIAVTILYLLMGTVMDTIAILVMTVPILYAPMLAAGVDPIHYCIVLVVCIEMGLITPPFAMNIFVISASASMKFEDTVKGVLYMYPAMFIGLALIVALPQISTFLPYLIYGK